MKQAHFTLLPNKIHLILNKYEKLSLSKIPQAVYSCPAFAKSKASRRKLNQSQANSNTPQACFFVCSTLTPKENNQLNFELVEFLSMVVRGRQGESLDRFSVMAEFLHSHALPPSRRKQRGNALNQQSQDTAMIFKFQSFTGEKRPTITVHARTEQEARQKVRFSSDTICIARLPSDFYERNAQANNRPNSTACNAQAMGVIYA